MKRIYYSVELLVVFTWHFLVANLEVAFWVFVPNRYLRPAVVCIPVRIKHDFVLAMMSWMISLTPGSLIVGISRQKRCLYVHLLHTNDPDKSISYIQRNYENRLLRITEPEVIL
ncbi:Na(+)/H(+) antiporter subunit E [compost metagenome]